MKEEGHYTISRVKVLPKKGNSNLLYIVKADTIDKFYRWLPNGTYEEITLGINNNEGNTNTVNFNALSKSSTIVTSRDFVLTDADGMNEVNNTGNITLTVRLNSVTNFPINTVIPLTRVQGSTGNVTIAYEAGVTGETGTLYTDVDGGALWQSAINTWQLIGFPKYNLDIFNTNILANNSKISYTDAAVVALNTAKVGVTNEEANPTDAEIVSSVNNELGTSWQTGGSFKVTPKTLTAGYIPTLADELLNTVFINRGSVDLTSYIEDNATITYPLGTVFRYLTTNTGLTNINFPSDGSRIYITSSTPLGSEPQYIDIINVGVDDWYAKGDYIIGTVPVTEYLTELNAAGLVNPGDSFGSWSNNNHTKQQVGGNWEYTSNSNGDNFLTLNGLTTTVPDATKLRVRFEVKVNSVNTQNVSISNVTPSITVPALTTSYQSVDQIITSTNTSITITLTSNNGSGLAGDTISIRNISIEETS